AAAFPMHAKRIRQHAMATLAVAAGALAGCASAPEPLQATQTYANVARLQADTATLHAAQAPLHASQAQQYATLAGSLADLTLTVVLDQARIIALVERLVAYWQQMQTVAPTSDSGFALALEGEGLRLFESQTGAARPIPCGIPA